jgi:uncharacterized protein (TIGR02246 family)
MTDTAVHEPLTVLDAVYRAWADNDADAMVAVYTDDATSIRTGSFVAGRGAIRDVMAAEFAGRLKGSGVRDEVQSVRYLGDAAAIVVSRSAVVLAGETDVPDDRWVVATWTLAREDGGWLLAAYHNCPG